MKLQFIKNLGSTVIGRAMGFTQQGGEKMKKSILESITEAAVNQAIVTHNSPVSDYGDMTENEKLRIESTEAK